MEKRTWALVIAAIPVITIPLFGFTWLSFSIFMLIYYFKEKLQKGYTNIQINEYLKLMLFGLIFSYLTEIFAIIDNIPKPPSQRILLNPNPLLDLYLAIGYYLPFISFWSFLAIKYDYTPWNVFVIGGSTGILMEQMGAIFLSMNPFAWLYVFLVYGSFKSSAILLADDELKNSERYNISIWKKVAFGLLFESFAFIVAGLLLWVLALPISEIS